MSPAKGATSGSSCRKESAAATAAATGELSFSTVDATPSASGDGGGGSAGGDGGPSADSLVTSLPMPVPLPLPASASSSSDTATAAASAVASSALALVSPFTLPPLAIGAAMTSSVALVCQSQPASAAGKNQITSSAAKNVPAFLNKLYNMVSDPASSDLIHWSDDGQAFIVERHEEFAQTLLPRFFKHNQFSSFVRQLDMYGFRKVPHLQAAALIQQHQDGTDAGGSESWEFANLHFQRNRPDLLCLVTRKKAGQSNVLRASVVSDGRRSGANDSENGNSDNYVSNGSCDPKSLSSAPSSSMVEKTVDVNALLTEISAIKRHQITISTDLKTIQREADADADDCDDMDPIESEDLPSPLQDTCRDQVLSLRRDILSIDPDERHALASHALSAITNLMVRGRSRVRDALVEAGIVDVLVRFLEHLVTDMETLSAMQQTIPVSVLNNVSNNRPQQQQQQQEEQQTQQPQDHQQQQPEITSMISIPHAPTAAEPLQNPSHTSAATQAFPPPPLHAHTEIPLLPGIRIRPAQTPAAALLLNKIVAQQHNLLMCCKILHVVSKYPHLRHYMHIDSVRPVRPSVSDLCGAAIVAAAAANSPEASANTGVEISAPIPVPPPSVTSESDSIRRNFDRFESALFTATGAIPVQSAGSFNQTENGSISSQSRTSQQISPVLTTVPILVFDHEPESEIRLLESLAKLPSTIPSLPPVPAQSGTGISVPQPRNHLIQTTLHYLPAPTNPRSAFELLEVFTTACSLVPEARTLTVATLRNAYRRDPVPTPAEGPHIPMGQAMGPCVYVDAETYVKSSPGSRTIQGWRNGSARPGVVVGLGHLRRCANLRCGRWEEGYKQFSKCSRCRRVSYCSKGCQRKAWVLHKNWCLKYTGDTTVTSTATTVPAAQPSADGFAVNADGAETAATMDFAVPCSSEGAGIVVAGGVHVAERAGTFMDETNGGGVLGGGAGNGGLF